MLYPEPTIKKKKFIFGNNIHMSADRTFLGTLNGFAFLVMRISRTTDTIHD